MTKPPFGFTVIVAIALVWNLAGLFAVVADLGLSAADISALPAAQQALYAARPLWSVVASVVAVVGGSLGCLGLLLRRRWSLALLVISLIGVVLQDIGLFAVAGAASAGHPVPLMLQSQVLIVAVALIALAQRARRAGWLA